MFSSSPTILPMLPSLLVMSAVNKNAVLLVLKQSPYRYVLLLQCTTKVKVLQ
jgi:hypothetical protein